jgi:hypothetical protein
VTDLAKCYFTDAQNQSVFDTCVATHLRNEVALFTPNIILSFTALLTTQRVRVAAGDNTAPLTLRMPHLAAHGSANAKVQSFVDGVHENRTELEGLGYSTDDLLRTWGAHTARALD